MILGDCSEIDHKRCCENVVGHFDKSCFAISGFNTTIKDDLIHI